MAAFAVARELDALLSDEHVDVLQIPGLAKAVGVNGLAPLVVGLLMAMAAVFSGENAARIDELAIDGHRVRGKEWRFLAEGVVVAEGYGVVELGGRASDMDVGGVSGGGQIGRRGGGSGRRCGVGGRTDDEGDREG